MENKKSSPARSKKRKSFFKKRYTRLGLYYAQQRNDRRKQRKRRLTSMNLNLEGALDILGESEELGLESPKLRIELQAHPIGEGRALSPPKLAPSNSRDSHSSAEDDIASDSPSFDMDDDLPTLATRP